MAWKLDGVDQYARFTMSAVLKAAAGGPMTLGGVVKLDATTDGALINFLDGTAARQFLEIFGTWNIGTAAAAKAGPAGATGTWVHVIVTKDTGNVPAEYTITPLGTGVPVSGTCSGGNLGNGAAPGASGQIQVGRFGTSAIEYLNGEVAATWYHASYMNQATREALNTWALTVTAASDGGNGWAVRYDALTTRTDATLQGGDETGRFGTAAITLAADPTGDAHDYFGGGGSDVDVPDTSGGASASGTPDTVVRGVVLADTSGGASAGGSADTVARGIVTPDTPGGASAGSSASLAPSVGVTVPDTPGGASAGSSASTVVQGVILADPSGGASAGSSLDAVSAGIIVPDGSGGASGGGSTDTPGAATFVPDTSGGAGGGSSPDPVIQGVVLGDASGGASGGSSAGLVSAPSDVTITDSSGGAGAGSSREVADVPTPTVVRDTMVMPVLLSALACLQDEAAKVEKPPALYTIRPGDSFEPSADPWTDECCLGIGWARMVTSFETYDFPNPATVMEGNCPPHSWAVVIEVGINRCVPVAGDTRGSVVTSEQWMAAAIAQADDGAALRRTLCCLRDLYDVADVTAGQVNPLPIQANCGGVVLQITVRRDACDCYDGSH